MAGYIYKVPFNILTLGQVHISPISATASLGPAVLVDTGGQWTLVTLGPAVLVDTGGQWTLVTLRPAVLVEGLTSLGPAVLVEGL